MAFKNWHDEVVSELGNLILTGKRDPDSIVQKNEKRLENYYKVGHNPKETAFKLYAK